MADSGIKKYRQRYSDLPPISSETEGYSIRYRLISEDRNRTSHWSPVYLIIPNYTYVPGNIKFSSGSQVANFTWDPVTVLKSIESANDIINKSLTANLATLTTSDAHYMNIGDWVTVENVDSVFNGTYQINAITNNTFSYYKDHANIGSAAVSPYGTRTTNSFVAIESDYDIWLRWGRVVAGNMTGDWIYKEKVSTTSVSYPHASFYTINGVIQPDAPNRVVAEIYISGSPVQRVSFLNVYTSGIQTI